MNDYYAFTIGGEKFACNLIKIKEFCLISDKERGKEQEVIDNFETNDAGQLDMVSKICREVKSAGNSQNDTIMYDLVKLFLTVLLSSEMTSESTLEDMDFSTSLSFNTLLENGIIYKID